MKVTVKRIKAVVTHVLPPGPIETEAFTGRKFRGGDYCIVQEIETKKSHTMINGSINQVPESLRIVGASGFVVWVKTTSYNLPFFSL